MVVQGYWCWVDDVWMGWLSAVETRSRPQWGLDRVIRTRFVVVSGYFWTPILGHICVPVGSGGIQGGRNVLVEVVFRPVYHTPCTRARVQ